ncbi:hypothetical protein [Streptomyces sp. NPDC005538]|uniref:hypothetical protein n=1 Tax=unclassified Streptomyces TaxID=2593676 RepID=UPI0033AFD6F5
MNEELAELAASGATALVSAMGTDLWGEAKLLMSGVLAQVRGGRRQELSAALNQPSTATRGAVDGSVVDYWTTALSQLLDRNPALAQDVMALTELYTRRIPDIAIQVNSATNSGELFAVQHGTQHFASAPNSRDHDHCHDSEERP